MQLQQWTEYGSVLQRQAAVVNALRNEVKELEEEYANLEAVLADGGQIRLLDQALSLIAGGSFGPSRQRGSKAAYVFQAMQLI